ncbi:ADP-heptose synthase [Paramagnetospirillum magneticum AMB-1]|uniref:ADP-heptose synthase n=1 Tax=Paramagnetospirillum magneticum (strain ATCC 700264 / AMB-1) TaxID=342108 RepID=Q2WBA9_PARM1|nr:ADP-heptose synthase [Paramagnetospirillum magneticum AMB-1]
MSNETSSPSPAARDKVQSIESLAERAEKAREAGKTVVLCHGVFDLVHLGHVRHVEAARREGDILFVTLTADRFVNKGPGRPIFSENMRAEMLAALACVDGVGVNHGSSAESVLDAIKPDIYVKGSDYENPDEDITGKINSEREAVERHGGRVVFTKDITFSSSSLINRYLDVYDPPLRDCLNSLRERDALNDILELIEKIKDMKVLLVGDTIMDEYQFVTPQGKAQKENIIATLFRGREEYAGGVIAAANHVASFCREVEIITGLGGETDDEAFIRSHLRDNVRLTTVSMPGRPTTRKTRYVEPSHTRKMFEVYVMDDAPLAAAQVKVLDQLIADRAPEFDVVIVTDFGHGLVGPSTIDVLVKHSRFLAVNAQTNSGNFGFNMITKYPKADYVCIDAPEARLAVGDKFSDIRDVVGTMLPKRIECPRMIVTHGGHGCYTYDCATEMHRIPAFTKQVVDTVGAGDAFLAVTSPLVAAGGSMEHVGFIGNAAGAMKVGIVGHRKSVEKVPLVKFVTALLK